MRIGDIKKRLKDFLSYSQIESLVRREKERIKTKDPYFRRVFLTRALMKYLRFYEQRQYMEA